MWSVESSNLSIENVIIAYGTEYQKARTYKVPVLFQGYVLELLIIAREVEQYSIYYYSKYGGHTMIQLTISQTMASLNMINKKGFEFLGIEKKGTWLMHLVLALVKALNLKTITLVDDAVDDDEIVLKYLRVFEGKRASWYRNFGFVPKHDVDDPQAEIALYHYPLVKLGIISDYIILGPYMLDLYQRDKDEYSQVMDQLCLDVKCRKLLMRIAGNNTVMVLNL